MKRYAWFDEINEIITEREQKEPENSYTVKLLKSGILKAAKKVGEEGTEVAIAAVAESNDRLKEECADLLFHLMVLLYIKKIQLDDVLAVLEKRHQK